MKFSVKFSAIVGLFTLAMCNSQVFAEQNQSFKGLKIMVGAGMTSAGGTSTTTGTGTFLTASSGGGGGAALDNGGTGTYSISESASFKPNNYIGRVELGYDWAVKERGIIGLSLSKDFKSMDPAIALGTTVTLDTGTCTPTTAPGTCSASTSFRDAPSITMDGPYALALRAGYATTKDTMVYAKLSYARSKISGTFNDTVHGVGLGLGFEGNLSEHWFMRGELESIRYNAFDVTTSFANAAGFTGSVTDSIKLRSNAARVLIGVRF